MFKTTRVFSRILFVCLLNDVFLRLQQYFSYVTVTTHIIHVFSGILGEPCTGKENLRKPWIGALTDAVLLK